MSVSLLAQNDSLPKKLKFTGDFRFRAEQDWHNRNSDGSYRDNRSRLRYRLRFGASYQYNEWLSIGMRIRTGNPMQQQDPQLTLGAGFKEFGTLPIGFEKIYFKGKYKGFLFWLGKDTFPFRKQNELFWSDNVYPEGVFLSQKFRFDSPIIQTLKFSAGHFIAMANGASFSKDNYIQGFQIYSSLWQNRFELFPSFYYFKNTPNIPDGNETFVFDYAIFHLGSKLKLINNPEVSIEVDYYNNLADYQANDSIPNLFKDQKTGLITALGIGKLRNKGDWLIKLTYTLLQQYAAVDFIAQNDWTRWDYSNAGSPDGRLTNFKGLEVMAGYSLGKKFTLKMRYFKVEQLVAYGVAKELGDRIRFDLDIGF
jgi:Putative porin